MPTCLLAYLPTYLLTYLPTYLLTYLPTYLLDQLSVSFPTPYAAPISHALTHCFEVASDAVHTHQFAVLDAPSYAEAKEQVGRAELT